MLSVYWPECLQERGVPLLTENARESIIQIYPVDGEQDSDDVSMKHLV